jgi:hypothetical protein
MTCLSSASPAPRIDPGTSGKWFACSRCGVVEEPAVGCLAGSSRAYLLERVRNSAKSVNLLTTRALAMKPSVCGKLFWGKEESGGLCAWFGGAKPERGPVFASKAVESLSSCDGNIT